MRWDGTLVPWTFAEGDQQTEIAVEGDLVVNDLELVVSAVLDGVGVGYLPEPLVTSHIAAGRMVNLLPDWPRFYSGIFLYHPSRRQTPAPLRAFLGFVERWRSSRPLAFPQPPRRRQA
ncbi:MAG: hypothetical protein JO127_09955 [Caulobacteraceae bacterium]|nr:hypothetical protein [Caulobacteraceae bacterium]